MASINKPVPGTPIFTHEGGKAHRTSNYNMLRRSVLACLLWEDGFYETGEEIAARIGKLVKECKPEEVAALAIEAREDMKLRHVPLLLVREMVRHPEHKALVAPTLERIIQRADELAEFLAVYWREKADAPIPNSVKRGLAKAFTKFNAHQLAKYNRDNAIKLRDVMFLVHPRPINEEQAAVWKKLAEDKLESPDTWEVQLSAGKDKAETFTRLINEKKLGGLALLRNLRNMTEAKVDRALIEQAILSMDTERILPYRFIAAAKYAPHLEPQLEQAMFKCVAAEKLKGRSLLVVDVSGSMTSAISGKSELNRIEAACGLAILLREVCDNLDVFTFASSAKQVPSRRGFALRDAIMKQFGGSTRLNASLTQLGYGNGYDRVIVITDGQTEDGCGSPQCKGYMLNVAAYQNGVGYGSWNTIDGWSEACVRYIAELEAQ